METIAPTDASYPAPQTQVEAEFQPGYPVDSGTTDSSDATSGYPAGGPGRTFFLVAAESQASYTVEEEFFSGAVQALGKVLGFFTALGVTNDMDGQITLDFTTTPQVVEGMFTVVIRSLTSDDNRRDNRIRSEFLESNQYPLATFVPLNLSGIPAGYQEGTETNFQLDGLLTIRDVQRPASFSGSAVLSGNVLRGTMTTTILMTEFGFTPPEITNLMKANNEALLTIEFLAIEN